MGAMQIPMIDTHHHLWHYTESEYGWIGGDMEVLKKDYLPEQLTELTDLAGVRATVVVQARQTVGETKWLLELAGSNHRICGVVGWIDLRSDSVNDELEHFAGDKKLVGVRHVLQDEPPGYMETSSFVRGIAQLGPRELAYDLLIYPGQLEEAIRLVGRFPEQTFVLDHMAKPAVRSGAMEPWKSQVETLARHPHVWCKISGLVTEAMPGKWDFETLEPYLDVVTTAFGTSRIMVGSDWPVCLLEAGYMEVMSIPRRFFSRFTPEEQQGIFYNNALKCYGLEC